MRPVLSFAASKRHVRFATWLCATAWLAAVAAAAEGNPVVATEALFITAAERQIVTEGGRRIERWVPTDKMLSFAWSDQPFVVHVPFVIEPRKVDASVFAKRRYEVKLNWRGLSAADNKIDTAGYAPTVLAAGVHRLDGQPLMEATDGKPAPRFVENRDYIKSIPNLDLVRLARQGASPAPFRGFSYEGPAPIALWLVIDPRHGIPRDAWTARDELLGVLEASVEEERYSRTASVQKLPVRIKGNGWKITEASVRWQGSLNGHVRGYPGDPASDTRFQDGGDQFAGTGVIAQHQLSLVRPEPGKPRPPPAVVTAGVEFPRLLDTGEIVAVRQLQMAGGASKIGSGLDTTNVTLLPYAPAGSSARGATRVTLTTLAELRQREEQDKADPVAARARAAASAVTGLSALPFDWAGGKPIGRHRLFEVAFVYAGDPKPARLVDVFAFRLSELESNAGGAVIAQAPVMADLGPVPPADDGFAEWVVKINEEREKTDERLQEIMALLQLHDRQILGSRRKYVSLVLLEQDAFPPDTSVNRGLIDLTINLGRTALLGRNDINLKPTLTKEVIEGFHRQRDALLAEIGALRAEQGKLIEEGVRVATMLIETADLQSIGSRDNPENLKVVRGAVEHFTDQRDLARLMFYDAAGWYDRPEFQQALAATKFQAEGPQDLAKLLEAKIALAQARSYDLRLAVLMASPNKPTAGSVAENEGAKARIRASALLREILQKTPDLGEARAMLADIELEMLSWIQAKLEREKRSTMAAFRAYFTARGYNENDPHGLWEGFKEYWNVCWGTSPISLFVTGAGGVAHQQATQVGLEQLAIAKNQVSLLALRRLVRSGTSLAQARQLNAAQMAERIGFYTVGRKELDVAKARRICQDIHETFAELYDLRALADGKGEEFVTFLERNYYQSYETQKGWTEAIGDTFLSPLGVLTFFGPSAVMRVGGRWSQVSLTAAQEASLVAQGVRVERGRDVFAAVFRLEQFGEKLAKSRVGPALGKAIAADQEFLQNCTALERFLRRDVGKLAAAVVIYGGVAEMASDTKIPALRMLVDAIAMLGAEELAFDLLTRGGSPLRALISKCEKGAVLVAAEKADLGRIEAIVGRVEGLQRQIASGRLSREQVRQLDDMIGELGTAAGNSVKAVAGVDKKANTLALLKKSAEAIKKGDYPNSARLLTAAKTLKTQAQTTVTSFEMALEQAQRQLRRVPAARQLAPDEPLGAMFADELARPILPPLPGESGATSHFVKYGDRALISNDLDKASDLYREAACNAQIGGDLDVIRAVEKRLKIVSQAKEELLELQRLKSDLNQRAMQAMNVESIADDVASRRLIADFQEGSLNKVWKIKDQDGKAVYWFKQPKRGEEELAVEEFAALAGQHLGIKVPTCTRVKLKVPNDAGLVEEVEGLLVRGVDGIKLGERSEAALLAMKKEIAKQKVFRFWLGDTDGHFGNILAGADGPWSLDFGMGTLKTDGRLPHIDADESRGMKEMMEEVVALTNRESARRADHAKWMGYHWMREADEILTYGEMKETLDRIRELCAKKDTLKDMLAKSLRQSDVEAVADSLADRVKHLDEALRAFKEKKTVSTFRTTPFLTPERRRITLRFAAPVRLSRPLAA